jgi:hypothetical protein
VKKQLALRLKRLTREIARAAWLKDFVLQDIQVYSVASPAVVSPQQRQERIQMATRYAEFLSARISTLTQQALVVRHQHDNLPEEGLLSDTVQNIYSQ